MSNNFDSTQAVLSSITDGKYDSTYSALKAAAVKFGAEDKDYDSEYSVAVALAEVAGNGGSGGGSSSNSEITMKDLIEEAKGADKFSVLNDGLGNWIAAFDEMFYVICDSDGNYIPLRGKTFNNETGNIEYIKNVNGEIANLPISNDFWYGYKLPIDRNEYQLQCQRYIDSGFVNLNELGISIGSPIPRDYFVTPYESMGMYQYEWGLGEDGEFLPPFDYMIDGSNHYDMSFYVVENKGGNINYVKYVDGLDFTGDGVSYVIGKFTAKKTLDGYGSNLPNKANKFVWENINPNISFYGDFNSSTKESYPQYYYDINELTLMRDREVVNEPIMAYPNISNSLYTYKFTLNSPLPVRCDCNNVKSNANISFIYCDLLKSLTLDYSRNDYGYYLYLTLPYNNTNLEHFNIEGNDMVKLRTGAYTQANSIAYMFSWLGKLKEVPKFDSSGVEKMERVFQDCFSLERVPMLDCGSIKQADGIFGYSTLNNLKHLGGFKDLKISIPSDFLDKCPNLTTESLMNVINNLYDLTANGLSGQTLKFGTTNLNKLTSDQIAVATNKGWTLT